MLIVKILIKNHITISRL